MSIDTRWKHQPTLDPFTALAGIVDDIATAFIEHSVIRAEARMSVEPDFYHRIEYRGSRAWERAGLHLATIAQNTGALEPGFTPQRLMRTLAAL